MHVHFRTLNGRRLTLMTTIGQFLDGPVLSRLAALQNHCDPADLVRDFLPPDLEAGDDEELAQVFGEACAAAARFEPAGGPEPVPFTEVTAVEVEPADLPFIRQRLLADPMPLLAA